MKKLCVLLVMAVMAMPLTAFSQDKAAEQKKSVQDVQEELKQKIAELEKTVKLLQDNIEKKEKEDKLKELLEKARDLSKNKKAKSSITRKFHSGLRQQSALNPNISVGGDFFAAVGKSETALNKTPSEYAWGTGNVFLREIEVSVQSALDPFSRGKVFFSFGQEGVAVEEGYVQWLNMPLNCSLRAGAIKSEFGKLNRYHDHALPQFDRPNVLVNFFGNSCLGGFGMSWNFLIPTRIAHVNELDVEFFKGGNNLSFTDEGDKNLIMVSHLKNYWDFSRSTYAEFGLSAAYGKNDPSEYYTSFIAGSDLTVKWVPPSRSKYEGITWRTEVLYSRRASAAGDINAWGMYSYLKRRLGPSWLVSGRFDYSQLPYESSRNEKGFTLAFDWWQSEFVFFRGQVTYVDRNFDEGDVRFILQTNWAMGPHKHEIY